MAPSDGAAYAERSISQEQQALNQDFYRHKPQDYFSRRLTIARSMLEDAEHSDVGTREYVALDLELLKFHVIETMLRYFNAHVSAPNQPWQKISGLQDRFGLTRELKSMWGVDEIDRQRMVARVVFGVADTLSRNARVPEVRNERLQGVEEFLSHFIDYYVDRGDDERRYRERERYNAAKHGLALVVTQDASFGERHDVDAIGLSHLEYERTDDGGMWRLRTVWTAFDLIMMEIFRAIVLLERIWTIGRLNIL